MLSGSYGPHQIAPNDSLWATRRKDVYNKTMNTVAELVKTLHGEATQLDKTPAQLALAWVLAHPEVTVAISGADTIEHIDDNLGGLGWLIPTDVMEKLNKASAGMRLILD